MALDNDEYGNARTGQSATRYNWLGGKQRSSETLSGLMLMGVRLYNPTSGRFLSTDPVYGGGDNAYGYPGDPVNQFDLDGRFWGSIKKWVREQKRSHASFDMAYSATRFAPGNRILPVRRPRHQGNSATALAPRKAPHPDREVHQAVLQPVGTMRTHRVRALSFIAHLLARTQHLPPREPVHRQLLRTNAELDVPHRPVPPSQVEGILLAD
ncbi:RHS repeat-associated core domain-containing protein [Streptomyces erythrochromogenes]|uniref:RHS repeat-associated core domain-containing protein n=1 Tax=Streptomyces erythrochromogenes TaxID=285574 RepID=UPI0037F136FD